MTAAADAPVDDSLARMALAGIVPVVTPHDATTATALARALAAGGLDVVEITMRTPAALASITAIAQEVPGVVVGAGTVTTARRAHDAIDAGARFLVSPGLDDGVVTVARGRGVDVLPGVATPTELMRAHALGIDTVKVFPVSALGGAELVRALASVWPATRFVPTGGISAATAGDYLAIPSVLAVGGSWMVDPEAVDARRWDDVTAASTTARSIVTTR